MSDPLQRMAHALVEADSIMWDNLLALRKFKGMSAADVAECMGISEEAVRRIEGERDCYLSTLRRYRLAIQART